MATDQTPPDVPISMPRLGDPAPDFEAITTQGPLTLSNQRGSWVILFSHPADFTPVCSTEFMAFARLHDEFARRNCKVVGLSIDSVFSHIAWVRDLERICGLKIPFPVIADLDMKVAKKYGMIQPSMGETAAVRAVFFIDPEGILRAMIYYPPSTGRNFSEILRVLDSLQLVDREAVATPADWKPGESVIVPPPRTQEAAERRAGEGYECDAWYLCRRTL
jgi:peroxiredoxin 2/4